LVLFLFLGVVAGRMENEVRDHGRPRMCGRAAGGLDADRRLRGDDDARLTRKITRTEPCQAICT
jgi:hypothetical protein